MLKICQTGVDVVKLINKYVHATSRCNIYLVCDVTLRKLYIDRFQALEIATDAGIDAGWIGCLYRRRKGTHFT